MKLKDIIITDDRISKKFPESFYRKHKSKEECIFWEVNTEKLLWYFNNSHPVTYILGETKNAPTGEEYVSIRTESDGPEEVEGALIYLMDEYRRLSVKCGKNFLYWRSRPRLRYTPMNDHRWYARARLLYSNKIPIFMKEKLLKDANTVIPEQWKCTYKPKKQKEPK